MSEIKNIINTINIMLIDDFHLRCKLKKTLEECGFQVCKIVTDPKKAISNVKKYSPDIVAIHLDLNFKENQNLGELIWHKFKIPIVYLVTKHDENKIKKTLSSEPYAFFYLGASKYDFKTNLENIYYKNTFLKTHFKQEISLEFLHLQEDFKLDIHNFNLYKKDTKINLTNNEKKPFKIALNYKKDIVPLDVMYSYIYRDELYEYGKLRTLLYRLRKKTKFDLFQNHPKQGYCLKQIDTI